MKPSSGEILRFLSQHYSGTIEQVEVLTKALDEIERLEQERKRDWAAVTRATNVPPTDWSDFGIPYSRQYRG